MSGSASLNQILLARENRAKRILELINQYSMPVVSFTMNIAGPRKSGVLIQRAFQEGFDRLNQAFKHQGIDVVHVERLSSLTGYEAYLAVPGDSLQLKKMCIAMEEQDALGRLFDMDVFDAQGKKRSRAEIGGAPRACLICGKRGFACASRRLHTVEQLQAKTEEIIIGSLAQTVSDRRAGA